MTSSVVLAKVSGNKVELGLEEFMALCNEVTNAKEVKDANEWLRRTRESLLRNIVSLEAQLQQNSQLKSRPQIVVYKRKLDDKTLYVQSIIEMREGDDGIIYVTVEEAQ